MVRPQALRSGSVSAAGLRAWTALLAAAAVLVRLPVHFASGPAVPPAPAPLQEYLTSPDQIWSSPPLPGLVLSIAHHFADPGTVLLALELLAVVTVIALLVRLGERWLDYRVGLFAAAAWALCGPAVAVFRVPGSEGWQAALSILCAAAMLRVARRRAPLEAWRIGLGAGVLSLFSGGGMIWAVAAMAWLPATSRKFRGRAWFALVGLVLAGWLLVVLPVVVRNAVLSGGEVVFPIGEAGGIWSAGAVDDPAGSGGTADLGGQGGTMTDSGSTASVAGRAEGDDQLRGGLGSRFVALIGGWLPDATSPEWTLPWWVLVVLAWGGVVALIPGTRFLFPLLLGGLVALLRGTVSGLDAGTTVAATPFVCLYAGYAVWRVASGWRSRITWIVLPPVLALALLVHFAMRGWS